MAETIADFIAHLGFKIDKSEEARFQASLDSLTKTIDGVAKSLAGAAASITATVIAVSVQFDHLYFASQRTNTTVASLKALAYGFEQAGGSAAEAQGMIEALNTAIITNPGAEKWLNNLGITTRDNGQLRDRVAILADLKKALSNQPYANSERMVGANLGIDEGAWRRYTTHSDEIEKYAKEQRDRMAAFGVDPDEAAKKSNELMTSLRQLMADIGALTLKITVDLQPQITKTLDGIGAWFHDHKDQIVTAINTLAEAVIEVAADFAWLLEKLKPVTDAFVNMAKSLGDDTGGVKWTMEALLAFTVGKWVADMVGAITKVSSSVSGLMGGEFGLVAMLGALAIIQNWSSSDEEHISNQQMKDEGDAVDKAQGLTPNQKAARDKTVQGVIDKNKQNQTPGSDIPNWQRAWNWLTGKKADAPAASPAADLPTKGGPFGVGTPPDPAPSATAPRADMVKVTTKSGQFAWVNSRYASQFQGFINDMESGGYKIKDLGGFNDRNIAGTNRPSWHSQGMAIDINPDANPQGTTQTDMPSVTSDLAKKWGLGWGMNWRSSTDPMHFSAGPNEGGHWISPEDLSKIQPLGDKSSMLNPPPLGGQASRSATLSQKTDITIIGSADPAGTSHTVGGTQSRVNADLLRSSVSAFG